MKALFLNVLFLFVAINTFAQGLAYSAPGLRIKNGQHFPDIAITNLVNAQVTSLSLTKPQGKFYILNFWGTWCAPCIPEMESLAKLQEVNKDKIQVIGISDDAPDKLKNFLKKRPSKLWLASDTGMLFYNMFGFNSVSQSAIISPKGYVLALVMADSINQKLIERLIKGEMIQSSAKIKEAPIQTNADIFGIDSTQTHGFSLRGYMIGQHSGEMHYKGKGPFQDRRITFTNSSLVNFYKEAYDIVSSKQIIYEFPEKEVADYENKATLYCLDLLVKPEEKDSLAKILQTRLTQFSPIKARIEYRKMPVYVLVDSAFNGKISEKDKLEYGFSGKGFDGTGVKLSDFTHQYLDNEMDLPVVDQTNLDKRYDIKTDVEFRTRAGIVKSIGDVGLKLVKQEQEIKVLVLYKEKS